ncbi:MAG: DUF2207 domain-containing protein [Clostridiales bacterium]|nr:DUF2207 domain-containing protein [Clostridiales bacterium]
MKRLNIHICALAALSITVCAYAGEMAFNQKEAGLISSSALESSESNSQTPAFLTSFLERLPFERNGEKLDNQTLLYPFIAALSSIILLMFKGRQLNPRFSFYPPSGQTPAEFALIIKGKVAPRDMLSMIFYWAATGSVSLTRTAMQTGSGFKRGFTIHRLKPLNLDANGYEEKLFREMFTYGSDNKVSTFDLEKSSFFLSLNSAAKEVKKEKFKKEDIFFKKSFAKQLIVKIPGIVALAMAIYPAVCGFYAFEKPIFAVLATAFCSFLLAFFLDLPISLGMRKARSSRWNGIAVAIAIVPTVALVIAFSIYGYATGNFFSYSIAALSCLFSLLISHKCRPRNERGSRHQETALGFRSFLESDEKARVNMLLADDPSYFFSIYPYAHAIGVGRKWARNFERASIERPSWFIAQDLPRMLASDYDAEFSSAIVSLSFSAKTDRRKSKVKAMPET